MTEDAAIVVEHLRVSAKKTESILVRDVSFSVQKQRIAGLIGESGSGKTVTARAIAGLLPRNIEVKADRLMVLGHDVHAWDDQHDVVRGRDVGFVFQQPMSMLTPVLTIGEQLTEGLRTHRHVTRKTAQDEAVAFLQRVGFQDRAKDIMKSYPHRLSGGMLQRIMIAMALLPRPKLLIADEPTTALDVTTQVTVLEVLSELAHDMAITVLFISHDMSVIANICHDVMVMQDGQIIETGTVDDVFAHPKEVYTKRLMEASKWNKTS